MRKTFKHDGKSCAVEINISPKQTEIIGMIDGKEASVKHLPPEDDIAHYAAQMEEELKAIVNKPRKAANPHLKTLKTKGYK